mgnify:CR=1 FL=1
MYTYEPACVRGHMTVHRLHSGLYNTPGGGSVLCIIRYYVLYVYNTERIIGVGEMGTSSQVRVGDYE